MRRHDNRQSLGGAVGQQGAQRGAGVGILTGGRLVQQQSSRSGRQHRRQCDPPLFAGAEHLRRPVEQRVEPELRAQLLAPGRIVAAQGTWPGGQFGPHRGGEQHVRRLLHHQAHLAGQFRHWPFADRPPQHPHHAALAAQQPIAMPQQSALARAVCPQQRDDFTRRAGQAGAAQYGPTIAFAPDAIPFHHRLQRSRHGQRRRFGPGARRLQSPGGHVPGQYGFRHTVGGQPTPVQDQHSAGKIGYFAQPVLGNDQGDAGGVQATQPVA